MTQQEKYSTNWDDSGWWIIFKEVDGKSSIWLTIEGYQDDTKAQQIVDSLNNSFQLRLKEERDALSAAMFRNISKIEKLEKENTQMIERLEAAEELINSFMEMYQKFGSRLSMGIKIWKRLTPEK